VNSDDWQESDTVENEPTFSISLWPAARPIRRVASFPPTAYLPMSRTQ
jgi:hypothetical protein